MTAKLAFSIVKQESTVNIDRGEIDRVKLDIMSSREEFYKEKTPATIAATANKYC